MTPDQLNAFAAALAALVAIAALLVTRSWTRFHKKLEITMHFQEAYATLEKEKTEVKSVPEADSWFCRYWNLQIRQYEYWLHGYIRDEIYIYWMACNKSDYDRPRGFPIYDSNLPPRMTPYSYAKGWKAAKKEVLFEEHPYFFKKFIERVLAHKQNDTFARCILDTKEDLFGWAAKLDRMTDKMICHDPRKLFHLSQRGCCPPCNAKVVSSNLPSNT